MVVDVLLPQWGMGMQEGTVLSWLKNVGDPVTEDEPIAVIEAAKVESELEAPATGVLVEIVAGEGDTVPVLGLLARISET